MSIKNLYPSVSPTIYVDYTKSEGFGSLFNSFRPTWQGVASTNHLLNANGLVSLAGGGPNIEYDKDGNSLGLAITGYMQNEVDEPENADSGTGGSDGIQTSGNITVNEDVATAPDGTSEANRITQTDNSADKYWSPLESDQNSSLQICQTSIFAKKETHDWIKIKLRQYSSGNSNSGNDLGSAYFRLTNGGAVGTVTSNITGTVDSGSFGHGTVDLKVTASIEEYPNDWYRCTVICVHDEIESGSTYDHIRAYLYPVRNGDNDDTDITGTKTLLVWGANMTSPGPSTIVSTWGADRPSPYVGAKDASTGKSTELRTDGSWWNTSEGTLIVESRVNFFGSAAAYDNYKCFINGVVELSTDSLGKPTFKLFGPNPDHTYTHTSPLVGSTIKEAFAYSTNDTAYILNGTVVDTLSSYTPPAVTAGTWNLCQMSGHLRKITYYPTRLTNAQIQVLTS
jgi:hypothetical protein|tara:strand:- start:123 stop:1481 length:1359 start_codon:yes stop_codon:yes gene_type:complete